MKKRKGREGGGIQRKVLVFNGSIGTHPNTSLVYFEQFANQFTEINTLVCFEIKRQFTSVPMKKMLTMAYKRHRHTHTLTIDILHRPLPCSNSFA